MLSLTEDYYGGKIAAYLKAYGTGYDFCRFCSFGGVSMMLFNSNAVICGGYSPEVPEMIGLLSPATVEWTEPLQNDRYTAHNVHVFTIPKGHGDSSPHEMISSSHRDFSLRKTADIIAESFDIDRDMWYVDMSHRIRHGVSEMYILNDGSACAAVDFISAGCAYISSVAVKKQARGTGRGRLLLRCMGRLLDDRQLTGIIRSQYSSAGFYRKCGLNEISPTDCGEKIYIIR
ncbi:MAG: GNAT family N-acetyltransferase [Huintestinicola sp.]